MKYSMATFRLYESESLIACSMRIVVTMKEEIRADVLKKAANEAIKRYPYFSVRVTVDDEGGYVLVPNHDEIAVLPVSEKARSYATDEVNGHLCFIEYEGRTIYFNMSHSICGGKGVQPWVMTTVYEYVKDLDGILPEAPGIRKPGEDLLEGEDVEPTEEMLSDEPPIYMVKRKNPYLPLWEYMNGLFNPFVKNQNYYLFKFNQKDIMAYAKKNDASVVSFFFVAIAKMLDSILPEKYRVIGGETSHNPSEDLGIPYSHFDMHSMINVDYEREMLKWDAEKLGTFTRSQIILQKDPTVSHFNMKKIFEGYDNLDDIKGLSKKKAYIKENNPRKQAVKHGSFVCNYSGQTDWGEVADYIDEYYLLVDGHLVFEISSLSDRIFLSMMQLLNTDKYSVSLGKIFDESGIPYEVSGPFPKHLSKHKLPTK